MRYCRFELNREQHYGLIESAAGQDRITHLLLPPSGSEAPVSEWPARSIEHLALSDAHLLPATEPSKIVCIGRNYVEHAKELNNDVPTELLIFLKPSSAVIAPGEPIRRPPDSQRVDHEGELGVVIGRRCRHVGEQEDVRSYIRGYTCVNDVTARDLQRRDGQWTRAKGYDTFCPIGPLVTDEIDPWAGIQVECRVNGELRQQASTRQLIFPLDAIIRYISRVMTLFPGDVIATGTPAGVSPLKAGDVVEVTVEGVGTLRNPVVEDTI